MSAGRTSSEQPVVRRGWLARHWKWAIPLAIVLLLLLAGGGVAAKLLLEARAKKNSPPYRDSLALVQKNPRVIEKIGEPIEDSMWLPGGEITTTGDRKNAHFNYRVAGPKGVASVSVEGKELDGKWALTDLKVKPLADSVELNLKDDLPVIDGPPPFDPNAASPPPATTDKTKPPTGDIALPDIPAN